MVCSAVGAFARAQPWQAYTDSAAVAEKSNQPTNAIHYLQLAQENLPKDSSNSLAEIQLLRKLAEQHLRLSQYLEAGKYLEEGLAIFKKWNVTLHPQYALLCDRFGRVLEATDPTRAEEFYKTSLEVTAALFTDSSIAYAITCNSLANFYYNGSEYKKAENMHLVAKRIKESLLGKDDPDYARTCNNLGAVYEAMGDFEKAEPLVLEARRIRQLLPPIKAHPVYAITCVNLANIYTAMAQYDKAETLYMEARNIRAAMEPQGLHADYAASCNRLADFYYLTRAFEKAAPLYQEALLVRAQQSGTESLDYAETCNNLATLYCDMGRLNEAEKLALQAKAIWDKTAPIESPDHAINRNNLGLLYYAMGKHSLALQYFMEARQLWAQHLGRVHPFYVENAASIAKVYWAMQQPGMANEYFEEALHAQKIQVDKLFRFTSEKEKLAYILSSHNFTDEYLSFCYKNVLLKDAQGVYDQLLLNRNLILTSLLQLRAAIDGSTDSLLQKQYESWIKLKKQIANAYSAVDEVDSLQVNTLEEAANAAEKMLANKSAAFKNTTQLPTWQQLQQQLGEAEASIEFVSFNYYNGRTWTDSILYAALLLRKGINQPVMIPLFEQRQLDSVWGNNGSGQQINSLYTRGLAGIKLLSKKPSLYPLVWKPMENYLKGIKKIYFAPAGELYKISFAAMAVNDKQVLSDLYELQQLNSTALIGEAANNILTVKDSLFLYGGIRYQADSAQMAESVLHYTMGDLSISPAAAKLPTASYYSYLPGTELEVDSIKAGAQRAGFYAGLLTGSRAVEESIASLNGSRSPAVLHVATHGFFNSNPLAEGNKKIQTAVLKDPLRSSGLLFAGAQDRLDGKRIPSREDGILTALEISTMHLQHTRLVVLSACQTALGAVQGEEGVYGLQRAFKMAGAQYLLMSLWDVGDSETAVFMNIFYGQLFQHQPIEKAFLLAQQKMKNTYRTEPEKWGAWVLVR